MKYGWIIAFFSLMACSQKEPEVIDIYDILPQSERYAEGDTLVQLEANKAILKDSLSEFSVGLFDLFFLDESTIQFAFSNHLLDRFKHKDSERWIAGNESVNVGVNIWNFKDSLSAKNAFFNWLDCFGSQCSSIRIWEDKKLIPESFILLLDSKKIVFLEGLDQHHLLKGEGILNDWQQKMNWIYLISQTKNGRCTWWVKDGEKLVPHQKVVYNEPLPFKDDELDSQ